MAQAKKYVVLADIESVRVPFAAFAAALDELSRLGEIAGCKFYGYSAKRTKDYGPFIQENAYDALSALPRKRKGKLDLRQVIDAARLAQFPNIDGFFLIYGSGDITPTTIVCTCDDDITHFQSTVAYEHCCHIATSLVK